MNILIFGKELASRNVVQQLINDFTFVKLITTNQSASQDFSTSTFLSISHEDLSNATDVIEILSKHENDPLDAVLLFNLSHMRGLNNVIQTMERLSRELPRLLLIFVNHENVCDENILQTLKNASERIPWTIIFCPEITSPTIEVTKYQIEKTSHPIDQQQTISATNLLDFLQHEFKTKNHLNQIVYLY